MGKLPAGRLQERVTLLTPGSTVSDRRGGSVSAGPGTQTTVWARVRPLKGSEKLALGQVLNDEVFAITIRRLAGVNVKQRALWKGKSLNVLAVAPDEDNEYDVLTCAHGGQSD